MYTVNHFKYIIEGVSKIPVPQEESYFFRGERKAHKLALGKLESRQLSKVHIQLHFISSKENSELS